MNKHDITTRWHRTWSERHPVLSELIGLIVSIVLVTAAAAMLFYAGSR